MQLAYQYRLKPTKEQKHTLNEWVELCRRQYNYRLGERFRWWETTRTPTNACPLNCSIVPVEEIYKNIPEFRFQTRDGRAKDENGQPKTKKGDKHPVGSYPRRRLNKKIAKLHQRIKRKRLQFHFEQAILLLKDTDVVFVEELSLKNIIRRNKPKQDQNGEYLPNGQAAKSGLNKSFVDAAHGQFVRILEWVAWKLGTCTERSRSKRVVKVEPWGTSQHCSQCFEKVPKELKDRWHSCPNCGLSLQRDHNSARLIKLVGLGVASLKNVHKERKPTLP